jgi:hypothetical protein
VAVGLAEALGELGRFRQEFYSSLTRRSDVLFELTDAVLCAEGPVRSLVDLTLVAEHRRGHGAMYDALNHGRVVPERFRGTLAPLPLPTASGERIVLAVDVSSWLRSGAPTSAERPFCHVYRRGRNQAQLIPSWPYSFVAALEPGRTSWTALLDAVRLGPADDATAVTARIAGPHLLETLSGQAPVVGIGVHVEVHVPTRHRVGVVAIDQAVHEFDHLRDVPAGPAG